MLLRFLLSLALCLWLAPSTPARAQWFDRTFVHGYASQLVNMEMGDFLWGHRNLTKMQPEFMVTLGAGAEKNLWGGFALGVEANSGLHWGWEDPTFAELSAALTLRYYFPWSAKWLPSAAFGDGVSFNTVVPEYEKRFGTGDRKKPMDSQWLNFLFVELEFLRLDQISFFYRVHHRCTIFGLVGSELPGGVNFHSVGIRYTF